MTRRFAWMLFIVTLIIVSIAATTATAQVGQPADPMLAEPSPTNPSLLLGSWEISRLGSQEYAVFDVSPDGAISGDKWHSGDWWHIYLDEGGRYPVDLGWGSHPRFSPTGRYIAYTVIAHGGDPSWIRMYDRESGRRIDLKSTQKLLGFGYGFSWSPDESSIVYVALDRNPYRRCNLWVCDVDTDTSWPITDFPRYTDINYCDWGPAGIAFCSDLYKFEKIVNSFDLLLLTNDGEIVLLDHNEDENWAANAHPRWHPNGQHLIFMECFDLYYIRLTVVDLNGNKSHVGDVGWNTCWLDGFDFIFSRDSSVWLAKHVPPYQHH